MRISKLTLLLSLVLVAVIWLGNFVFLLSSTGFHSSELKKLGSNETIGINAINYLNGRDLLGPYFSERESSHLYDVKSVFSSARAAYYVSLLLLFSLVFYLFVTRRFVAVIPRSFAVSGAFSLVLLLLVFILSLSFSGFFSFIHHLFFASGTWLFPPDSILIRTFPEQFFSDFTSNFIRLVFVNSALFFGIGLFAVKKVSRLGNVMPGRIH